MAVVCSDVNEAVMGEETGLNAWTETLALLILPSTINKAFATERSSVDFYRLGLLLRS